MLTRVIHANFAAGTCATVLLPATVAPDAASLAAAASGSFAPVAAVGGAAKTASLTAARCTVGRAVTAAGTLSSGAQRAGLGVNYAGAVHAPAAPRPTHRPRW